MRLILNGPPGSGKGTQALLLCQRLGLAHFATGDILRTAIRLGTPEGKQAQAFVAAGRLVPDEVVNEIVFALFRGSDRPTRFVIDGYPRNLGQALAFERMLQGVGLELDAVISLVAPDEEIVQRLSARWACSNPQCQATYNTLSKPPQKPGVCDLCQSPLVQREDDKPHTVRERLRVFHQLTDELITYYRDQGLLIDVLGVGDIETIYQSIVRALERVES
jgi:adenylate kinase